MKNLDSFLFFILFFLLLDQLSKELALRLNVFSLHSSGFFSSFFPNKFHYLIVGGAVFIWILYRSLRNNRRQNLFWSWLLAGGILGNAFDRFYRGGAVDFINLRWFLPFWPEVQTSYFNLADVFIMTGLIAYGVSLVASHDR